MLRDILTLSALIVAVLLVRAIFKNRVPKRMIYALWLVVLLKLCLPGTLVSLPVLPAEDAAAPTQSAEQPVQTTPVIQQPAQTVMQPQTPAQQQVSPAHETAKPAAKPLTTAQILQIAWYMADVYDSAPKKPEIPWKTGKDKHLRLKTHQIAVFSRTDSGSLPDGRRAEERYD